MNGSQFLKLSALPLIAALSLSSSTVGAGEPDAPPPPAAGEDEGEKPPSAEELARIKARVAELVKQLGNEEWAKREEATDALVELGEHAEPALEEATKSKDAEVSTRAADALRKIRSAPKHRKKKVDPNATDGYQPVYEGVEQVQTFKAPADKIDTVRIRAARTFNNPAADLTVSLRESGKEEALASAEVSLQQVTRFYHWYTLELKAEKLEKGKTYELVFASITGKESPWLINSFYRDAYPDGEHREVRDGKPVKSIRKCDLVFEALSGDDKATSVPKDVDLSKKDQHFGIGPDGIDLQQKPVQQAPLEQGGAL